MRYSPAMVWRALALLLLFVITAVTSAPAQTSDADTRYAAEEKKKGDAAMDERRYEDALQAYERASIHASDPVLHYNRARALQYLARYPAALDAMERFDREASPQLKARVPTLTALLADLRQRVATVRIRCNVPNARVVISNQVIGTTPLEAPVRLNAGDATIEVEAEDHFSYQKAVTLPGGETTTIDIALQSKKPTPAPVLDSGPTNSVSVGKSPPVTSKAWFWITLVSSALIIAGGVVFTVYALTTERAADRGDLLPGQAPFP
jgi:hypothetical protein